MTDIDDPTADTSIQVGTRGSTQQRVQLLINDREKLETISHLLGERFTTVIADGIQQADLYIVDDNSFQSYREALEARKAVAEQVFCPVVLVRRQSASLDPFETSDYDIVDQIISAPLEAEPFVRTLENLLSWRADTITLVKQTAELQRREAELERYEAYIQESTDIILTLDATHRIEYASPSVQRILGYAPETVVDTDVVELVHPADRTDLSTFLDGVVQRGTDTATTETRVETARGDTRWVEIRGRNQLDNPALGAIVTNIREITEQKRHEQELEQQNERLEQFASVLSHDLRNPLNVAQLRTDLLDRDSGDDENIDIVQNSLNRIETMVDDLLMLARTQTKMSETGQIRLAERAKEAWRTAQTGESSLVVDIPQEYSIDGNRDLLQNVFENLYRNAVDHNETPVTVHVGVLDDQRGFFVEDDGTGIPADERDEIFDYGYTTSQSGTGLGLSIVRNLVQAHGWAVTITDGTDGGARFEITGVAVD